MRVERTNNLRSQVWTTGERVASRQSIANYSVHRLIKHGRLLRTSAWEVDIVAWD